jgi:hypothetical protein
MPSAPPPWPDEAPALVPPLPPPLPRYLLRVEYDGAEYSGWQRQRAARSVQAALEARLCRAAHAHTCLAHSCRRRRRLLR